MHSESNNNDRPLISHRKLDFNFHFFLCDRKEQKNDEKYFLFALFFDDKNENKVFAFVLLFWNNLMEIILKIVI